MKCRRVHAGQAKDAKLRPSCLCPFSKCVCTFMPVWGHRKTIKSAISVQ